MRLTEIERSVIVASVKMFDDAATIYLFGSRADDRKRGGDIDILLISDVLSKGSLDLIGEEIFKHLDEQKIDLVLSRRSEPSSFAEMVISKGVVDLCPTKN
jgi:predicted nucleotidyltransferase